MKALLYRFSKTSQLLIGYCNTFTQKEQRTLGFFVFLTATFAFISGYYALTAIFGEWDAIRSEYHLSLENKIITFIIASLYALMIGAIDREIVAARSKIAVVLRVPMAIIIGFIIAVPLEIKILENKINQQIIEIHQNKLLPFKLQKDEFIETINQEILDIETKIDYYSIKKDDALKKIKGEALGITGKNLSGKKGQGSFYKYAIIEKQNCENEIYKLESRLRERKEYRDERLKELAKDFRFYKTDATFGLWEKYMVMHQIINKDKTGNAKVMSYGISLLFILLELIPSLIKLLSRKNEYNMLLYYLNKQTKRKLKNALTISEFNDDPEEFIRIPEIRFEM